MRTFFLIFLASLLLFPACSTTPPPPPPLKAVGSVKQLMNAIVMPSADVVWHVAAKAPEGDEGWTAVQNSALTLAESGNLLMVGSRAKDQDAWMKASQALMEAATVAFQAAQAKNVDAITAAGDQINETCEGCHTKYMPKSEESK